jgi:hypothetical protein
MSLPGFQAEAALGAPPGYRIRWRSPVARVTAARPDCLDCDECPALCDWVGQEHPACDYCWSTCGSCPYIPGPLEP